LTAWWGEYGDYREIEGLLVPHQVSVSWPVDGQRIPYARFLVERPELDATTPF
jgi:hypothetical protein